MPGSVSSRALRAGVFIALASEIAFLKRANLRAAFSEAWQGSRASSLAGGPESVR